jgi:hypothetical protein
MSLNNVGITVGIQCNVKPAIMCTLTILKSISVKDLEQVLFEHDRTLIFFGFDILEAWTLRTSCHLAAIREIQ